MKAVFRFARICVLVFSLIAMSIGMPTPVKADDNHSVYYAVGGALVIYLIVNGIQQSAQNRKSKAAANAIAVQFTPTRNKVLDTIQKQADNGVTFDSSPGFLADYDALQTDWNKFIYVDQTVATPPVVATGDNCGPGVVASPESLFCQLIDTSINTGATITPNATSLKNLTTEATAFVTKYATTRPPGAVPNWSGCLSAIPGNNIIGTISDKNAQSCAQAFVDLENEIFHDQRVAAACALARNTWLPDPIRIKKVLQSKAQLVTADFDAVNRC